jgi:hypothetical protein
VQAALIPPVHPLGGSQFDLFQCGTKSIKTIHSACSPSQCLFSQPRPLPSTPAQARSATDRNRLDGVVEGSAPRTCQSTNQGSLGDAMTGAPRGTASVRYIRDPPRASEHAQVQGFFHQIAAAVKAAERTHRFISAARKGPAGNLAPASTTLHSMVARRRRCCHGRILSLCSRSHGAAATRRRCVVARSGSRNQIDLHTLLWWVADDQMRTWYEAERLAHLPRSRTNSVCVFIQASVRCCRPADQSKQDIGRRGCGHRSLTSQKARPQGRRGPWPVPLEEPRAHSIHQESRESPFCCSYVSSTESPSASLRTRAVARCGCFSPRPRSLTARSLIRGCSAVGDGTGAMLSSAPRRSALPIRRRQ